MVILIYMLQLSQQFLKFLKNIILILHLNLLSLLRFSTERIWERLITLLICRSGMIEPEPCLHTQSKLYSLI